MRCLQRAVQRSAPAMALLTLSTCGARTGLSLQDALVDAAVDAPDAGGDDCGIIPSDAATCAVCGMVCPPSTSCVAGQCVPTPSCVAIDGDLTVSNTFDITTNFSNSRSAPDGAVFRG
jgi:hypothetical protein